MTRVVVQHFGLPRYRVPFFQALAAAEHVDLEVRYGRAPKLANADADGFEAEPSAVR
jgi:hypothetical protein